MKVFLVVIIRRKYFPNFMPLELMMRQNLFNETIERHKSYKSTACFVAVSLAALGLWSIISPSKTDKPVVLTNVEQLEDGGNITDQTIIGGIYDFEHKRTKPDAAGDLVTSFKISGENYIFTIEIGGLPDCRVKGDVDPALSMAAMEIAAHQKCSQPQRTMGLDGTIFPSLKDTQAQLKK